MIFRLALLTVMACSLSSCGIAQNFVGRASGFVGGAVNSVTGGLRLADVPPDAPAPPPARPETASTPVSQP